MADLPKAVETRKGSDMADLPKAVEEGPDRIEEARDRLDDHPFTTIETAIEEAAGWVKLAADVADDLTLIGVPASQWATAWRHIAGLLTVPDGVKEAVKGEEGV